MEDVLFHQHYKSISHNWNLNDFGPVLDDLWTGIHTK